ncbi:COL12A [Mytilus edulis]|uniref:COL12A n=1 Tax=Mytilus edulis TaxID=6550 RepID=A0A8S3UJ08_MYTED|nr:COL12A [Mytilus edulis]
MNPVPIGITDLRRRVSAPENFDIVDFTDRSLSVKWYMNDSDNSLEYQLDHRILGSDEWISLLLSSEHISTNEDDCQLKWDSNDSDNCLEYKLVDQLNGSDDCQEKLLSTKDVSTKENGCYVYKLQNLSPDTCYQLKLCSVDDHQVRSQHTENQTRKTLKIAPQNFDIIEYSDRSITVKWYMNDLGDLQQYELNHRLQGSDNWNVSSFSLENASAEENESSIYKLENLSPGTCYELKMCSVQNNVRSEYSKNKLQQTLKIALPEAISRLEEKTGLDIWSLCKVLKLKSDILYE